jgi:hypothetical protein
MKINKIINDLREVARNEEKRKIDEAVAKQQTEKDKAVAWFDDRIKMWISKMFINPDRVKVDFGLYNRFAEELWAHAPLLKHEFEDFGIEVSTALTKQGEWIFIYLKETNEGRE